MIDLKAPSRMQISKFTFEQFKIVDEDGSGAIEYCEFEDWIANSIEIQDFMLKYTGMQTIRRARMRFESEIS